VTPTDRPRPGEVPDVHLVLRPLPDAVPSAVRLRRLVKSLLRAYSFRLVSIRPVLPADAIADAEDVKSKP
jgi:hypothetical protein